MHKELSSNQARVYELLKQKMFSTGSMPTLREICKEMGWKAVGTAQDVIQALIEKGFIQRKSQKARGLSLKDTGDFRSVPVLGAAPAGNPVEAIEHHRGDVIVPSFLRGPIFAVRVQGDSMKDAGIEDQDLAIVKQSESADSGEIVVARVSGEVTIKRFVKKRSELWLYPENPKYKPRQIEDPEFRILGRVIGLHRYWNS